MLKESSLGRAKAKRPPQRQSGVMLLEVLIAILIFAFGVLGLVGLHANATKQSSQAKYRADATMLANELIGQMWLSERTPTALDTAFASAAKGDGYKAWAARVSGVLPGAETNPPLVSIEPIDPLPAIVGGASAPATGLTPSTRVTITMRWKHPSEPASATASNLVFVTEIK